MLIDRVLAPNPGPFTGAGTNTYVVGDRERVIVLDPGPLDRRHEAEIVKRIAHRAVDTVLVTHTHSDHAPLANPMARDLGGVPVLGHAPGPDFLPDELLEEGNVVWAGATPLEVVHTPGHAEDHVCFLAGGTLFSGDHILGGSSVMVDDVGAYMRSLEKVERLSLDRILPGHGPEVEEPKETISWYIAHRRQRETQILDAVLAGARTVGEVVEDVYREVDHSLYPLAARSVSAHLHKLHVEGLVVFSAGGGWDAEVEPA